MSKKEKTPVEMRKEPGKSQKLTSIPGSTADEKKRKRKGSYKLYKIEGEKITRLRPICERCGPGYFMAKHEDRYTCGHCGFTRYRQIQE